MEMNLKEAAENGNVSAIEQYADSLIQEKNWTSAHEWLLKGSQHGSYYCMIKYAHLTIALTEAGINISSDTAEQGIADLIEAEKWANTALRAGQLENDDVLYSATGIYAEMTWCYYVRGLKTKDTSFYVETKKYFEKIKGKPQSREMYAYMMALDSLGEAKKAFDVATTLHDDHDDTLKPFMLEVVCSHLSQAFFEGNVVQPSFDRSYAFAQEYYNINPEENEQLFDFYRSGNAKRQYESMHNSGNSTGSNPKKGCYIATCVYGSYDCPEVWALRRFRDNILDTTWYGKLFIWLYYRISPLMVRIFGTQKWFVTFWRKRLDAFVKRLIQTGTDNTTYYD